MIRIILGVLAGFIAWSIVWVGSDQVLQTASPNWIGAYARNAEAAFINNTEFVPDSTLALVHLIRSFLTSIIGGFVAALVAGENRRSPLALGVVLLLVGAGVEIFAWRLAPAWYHIVFLLALIPMTILGARLRSSTATAG